LTKRGTLECLSCHDPHSSETEHLLVVSAEISCVACHGDK
jgi:predicted CXXCH cytochrome family protein